MRGRIVVALAALALSAAPSTARAAGDVYPLTGAHRSVDPGTLFESGVAASEATSASIARARLVRDGEVLYAVHCSTCHGANLEGSPGAPSLSRAGGAAVDFYVTTGRMPVALRASERGRAPGIQAYHVRSLFDARQTAAIEAFVDTRAEHRTPIPIVHVDAANIRAGRRIFENNCQACHGAAAQGATAGEQWVAPALDGATPTQIGEAIRIGPGVMPRFTPGQLSARDVDAVASYVRYLATEPQRYGGAVMGYLGPISEGAVSGLVGIGVLFFVSYYIGTKVEFNDRARRPGRSVGHPNVARSAPTQTRRS